MIDYKGEQDYRPDMESVKDSKGYTKGEWRVGKSTDSMGYETPIYADTEEGRDYEIATVHIYNGEQIANAQLIASAPDLYEACLIAINEIERLAMVTGYVGEAHYPRIAQIKQALAKAAKVK